MGVERGRWWKIGGVEGMDWSLKAKVRVRIESVLHGISKPYSLNKDLKE